MNFFLLLIAFLVPGFLFFLSSDVFVNPSLNGFMSTGLLLIYAIFFVGYLIGSVTFGVLIAFFYKTDLRSKGSGSVGATNVVRVLGKKAGILVFLLDFLKGYLMGFLVAAILKKIGVQQNQWVLILFYYLCLAPFFGHIFSIFQKLRGGKGIATFCGILFFLTPMLALSLVVFFYFCFRFTKIVSISSIFVALLYPLLHAITFFGLFEVVSIYHFFWGAKITGMMALWQTGLLFDFALKTTFIALFCCCVILYAHRDNLKRIIEGKELAFSKEKK